VTNADLPALGRELIDTTYYLTLATADSSGTPHASPVYFAPHGYGEFYWISSPNVTHSINIHGRPQVSITIFDSTQTPGSGRGIYFTATAAPVPPAELDAGITIYNSRFPNPSDHSLRTVTRSALEAPAPYRLYRAIAHDSSMLCRRPTGQPCPDHNLAYDHRTPVTL
jgi:uncharacterized protein YhbP (UPF0306 family)